MIESNDLRLGNLVHRRGEEVEVVGVDREFVDILAGGKYGDYERWYFDGVDEIALTEEWLRRFGFKEAEWFKGVHSCGDFSIEARDFQSVVMGRDDFVPFGKPIQYVHQLQNLFYSLCGEELKVNLQITVWQKTLELLKNFQIMLSQILGESERLPGK